MRQATDLNVEYRACYHCGAANRCTESFCMGCGKPILLNLRYEVVEEVKSGAMGCIFRAEDRTGKRTVALKQMLSSIGGSEDRDYTERRFSEEAGILSKLHHGGLPEIFDYFRINNPVTKTEEHYIAMTFFEGKTMEALIKWRNKEPLSLEEALDYFMQLLNILTYLHCHHPPVLHRDLNPRNCMIHDGTVFLIDFGIARIFVPHKKGTAIGTPGYAPPEQYQGFVDQRSDIYSLGVMMHYLLTGQDPEASGKIPFNFEDVTKHNARVPRILAGLIASMVDVVPDKRPQSVGNIINVLISLKKKRRSGYTEYIRKRIAAASRLSTAFGASLGEKIASAFTGNSDIDQYMRSLSLVLPESPVQLKPVPIRQSRYSSIFEAAKKNDPDAVKEFIDGGSDINERDSDGSILLHVAIMHGSIEIVELLLWRGADLISKDKNGWTPMHCAAWSDNREIAELLVIHGAKTQKTDNYGMTPAALAEYHGKTATIMVIERHETLKKSESLHDVFGKSRKYGVKTNVDINDVIDDLKKRAGIEKSYYYQSAFSKIAENDMNAIIDFIAGGLPLDVVDLNGDTMLHRAIAEGNEEMAELLIMKRMDLNAANNHGRTPLHIAARKDMCETARLIIRNGCRIDKPDDLGFTALHVAARYGNTDMAELLISEGSDMNKKDNRGWTALHFATHNCDEAMISLLMSSGAEVTIYDKTGQSPLDAAELKGKERIARLLRKDRHLS